MGVEMKVKESVHKKLDNARMRNAMAKAVKQTMYDLMKAAIKEAPGPGRSRTPNPTGNLRRSHSVEVRLDSNMIEGLLKNSANYWRYVQFGTSKMDADDFVTRAFNKVEPSKKTAEYFHNLYKE